MDGKNVSCSISETQLIFLKKQKQNQKQTQNTTTTKVDTAIVAQN